MPMENSEDCLRFVVTGIGGYAVAHMEAIDWLADQGLARLSGVVALDEDRQRYPDLVNSLESKGVALFGSVEELLGSDFGEVDVLTLPIGIHLHVPMSIAAMRAGLHVYCEKPAAATVQEVDKLIAVERETNKKIAIGFQHIYSHSMQQLKARICEGRLGQIKSISLMCGWPRSQQYYARNDWAGRLRKNSDWILDSPANNAHAHYLFNMLYLSSTDPNGAAFPIEVRSELYRANRIESADTIQMQFKTEDGTAGHIILTHCNEHENGPFMRLECENGNVEWHTDNGKTSIKYRDDSTEELDNLVHDKWRFEGFRDFVQAIQNNTDPICTPELARSHTLTINAMHESCPEITQIPEKHFAEVEDWEMFPPDTKGDFRIVEKMDEYMRRAYAQSKFLSELEIPWAKRPTSQTFKTTDYCHFPENPRLFPGGG